MVRGRLTLGPALDPGDRVEVYYHYGFPADLGGGPYRRRAWLMRPDFAPNVQVLFVDGSGAPGTFATIAAALDAWVAERQAATPSSASATTAPMTRRSPSTSRQWLPTGTTLAIEAADGVRPHLRLDGPLQLSRRIGRTIPSRSAGCLIEGRIEIARLAQPAAPAPHDAGAGRLDRRTGPCPAAAAARAEHHRGCGAGHRRSRPTPNSRSSSPSRSAARSGCRSTPRR